MEDVLTEVMELFPSKYIHIGGDEAPKYRWEHCKKCQQRIKEENLHDEHELQSYFITRIEKFLNENERQLIGWDEILEGGLAPSATVQSWRGEEGGIAAAKSGHDAIMSPTSHCYFDYGLDATDLKEVYHYEPITAELTEAEAKHILGGECNMWSERAPQELVDSKVFPRILAMSEVLWSTKEKDYDHFYARVQKHYSKLDAMGVKYGFESVPITSTVLFNADSFAVSLFKGSPDMRLEYSFNNKDWQAYTVPFGVNETSTLMARGFKNEKPYGEFEQEIIRHIATGKKVNYTIPYSRHYKGTGDNNLTDGLLGSVENFRDGYYQGFSGTDFEVVIDLGETTTFSSIQTTFFQYYLSWIVLPTVVSYAVSEDGKNFTKIETIANKISLMQEGKFKHTFKVVSQDLKARYVKVKATTVGKLPKEHPAAGSDAWIFVDEVIIE
jgi:hexosaminidase